MSLQSFQAFLSELGARFSNGQLQDFGDPASEYLAAEKQCFISYLDDNGLISVSGEDARTFLQGQFSNDINLIDQHRSQLNSYSSPQGRLYAVFRVFLQQDCLYIDLPKSLREKLLQRLKMFVLRSKVSLSDCSEQIISTACAGLGSDTLLQAALGQIPQHDNEVSYRQDITVIRLPGSIPRFQLYAAPSNMLDLWQQLHKNAQPVAPSIWKLQQIRAGIPTIYPQTSEAFVAQMVNLDLIDAVNFKKGCYPGQEVIARMHYRGKSKRRMFYMRLQSELPVSAGNVIYQAKESNYQPFAEIVDSVHLPDNRIESLAVTQYDRLNGQNQGQCYIAKTEQEYQETPFEILELPYKVPHD